MWKALTNSLEKLGTDHLEIYMMHTVTTLDGFSFRVRNGALEALKEARREGVIDFIGISSHRISLVMQILETNDFDVVEIPYGIGQTESEKLFELTREKGVGVIAIRTLGGGILVDRLRGKAWSFMNPRNALGYVLSNPNISTALVGMSSIKHVKENIDAVNSRFPSVREKKDLERKVEEFLGVNFCRGCKACMPCDVHGWKFGIDDFFRMEIFYSKYGMKSVLCDYGRLSLKTDICTGCGECEARCPYRVPIVQKLKQIHQLLKSQRISG
jgi:predicted aldo/keto reductase-like oxidoreductase